MGEAGVQEGAGGDIEIYRATDQILGNAFTGSTMFDGPEPVKNLRICHQHQGGPGCPLINHLGVQALVNCLADSNGFRHHADIGQRLPEPLSGTRQPCTTHAHVYHPRPGCAAFPLPILGLPVEMAGASCL